MKIENGSKIILAITIVAMLTLAFNVKLAVAQDVNPPTTTLTIGEPKYVNGINTYVMNETLFTLEATDDNSGVGSTAYRIYNDTYDSGWQIYTAPFNLTLLPNGNYTLAYNSTDNEGNVEETRTQIIILTRAWDNYGDVTGGGKCTLKDLVMLAKAFKQKPGDSNWNPIVDFAPTLPKCIDLLDLVTFCAFWHPSLTDT